MLQTLVTAWLQESSLRPLDTIPAKTQHDDITSKMFEGGKCNPIFLFIFLNVESLSSFSEGEGNTKVSLLREKAKSERRGVELTSFRRNKVKTGALETCLPKITLTDRLPVQNLHRPSSPYICLPVSFRHKGRKRERKCKKKHPDVRFLSTSLVFCRFFSLSKVPRLPSIKSSS